MNSCCGRPLVLKLGDLPFTLRDLLVALGNGAVAIRNRSLQFAGFALEIGQIALVPNCLAPQLSVFFAHSLDLPAKSFKESVREASPPRRKGPVWNLSEFARNHPSYEARCSGMSSKIVRGT